MQATVLKAPHGDLSSCMEMVMDLPGDQKKRDEAKKCTSVIASKLPNGCKYFSADTKDELHKFMFHYKEQSLNFPIWRNQRAYVATQKVEMLDHNSISGKCTFLFTGYVRARSLSVNQLVHVAGAGDYQLCKIEILKDPFPLNPRKGQDAMDADDELDVQVMQSLTPDSLKQEALLIESIPDPLAGEQTYPTPADFTEAEEYRKQKKIKKEETSIWHFRISGSLDSG